jgi:hypothetical protein
MKKNDFAVFIVSHGRPNKVVTWDTLIRHGFTGKVYIVIDNEDKFKDEYVSKYGKSVIIFDKAKTAHLTDTADNLGHRRSVIFARNENFDIAERLGVKWFLQLDDDYDRFAYKFSQNNEFIEKPVKNLDRVFEAFLEYYKSTKITSLAMAQMGDFVGGITSGHVKNIKPIRKVMNSFFLSTERRFKFIGRMNDDVNTYVKHGAVGMIFMTILHIALNQKQTQSQAGGLTELYIEAGTYTKSFYSVMIMPSAVKVAMVGDKHPRIHHQVSWKHAVPCILNESFKKTGREAPKAPYLTTPALTLTEAKTTWQNGKKRPKART